MTTLTATLATVSPEAWEDGLLAERLRALDRTGQRLGRIIDELKEINDELERLDQILFVPGLPEQIRRDVLADMDLSVGTYNHLRDAASEVYRQLVLQRECCGFRSHAVLRECYPIPELHAELGEGSEELVVAEPY
jgi:hypothetical protein